MVSIRHIADNTAFVLSSLVSNNEGLKVVGKFAKSATETIKKIQEVYCNQASEVVGNLNTVASNLTGIITFVEPCNIIKDCLIGDKEGKKPWAYLKDRWTFAKGMSWFFKKTAVTIEFFKYLNNLKAIQLPPAIMKPVNTFKSFCELGYASMTIADKSVAIYKANQKISQLQGVKAKWVARKAEFLNKDIESGSTDDKIACLNTVKKLCQHKLQEAEKKKHHESYAKWKTLEIYANLDDSKVSLDSKVRRFEKYYMDQIGDAAEKIENQNKVTTTSALGVAFGVGIFALSIFTLITTFTTITGLSALIMGVGLVTNTIGLVRMSMELLHKKEQNLAAVKLPSIII